MKTTFIYALCEPGTRTVRYIGKTCDLARRYKEQLRMREKTHLGNWIRNLASSGQKPEQVALWQAVGDGAKEERRHICIARAVGMRLVNLSDGGEGLPNPPKEIREKIASSLRGRFSGDKNPFFGKTHTPESREVMGAVHRGVPLPAGHPFIGWCKGKPRTAEHRANLSEALTKHVRTPEHCAAISAGKIAANARRRAQDQEIEWALAPYTLTD